ncbi:MAG: NUDIX hydrolase [Myxococcota bacterium]|nr:NUDIX hydrolase [Myxococcota bacterium]
MHRDPLLAQLAGYRRRYPGEGSCVDRFEDFVRQHPDCFERSCVPGHITASSWILSAEGSRFLLTHHRKLGRWLQLGGHADGETDVRAVALREAREESGLSDFEVVPDASGLDVLDLDIHRIPPHGRDPEHFHYDVRFLFCAAVDHPVIASDESHEVRWFDPGESGDVLSEESLRRLMRKSSARLDTGQAG